MKRVYVDMDNVLADFWTRYNEQVKPYLLYPQSQYGFFASLDPMPGALDAMAWLETGFDTWILTRPSVKNPLCYTEKRVWVDRLILCPNKALVKGDFLIDDSPWPGFEGEQLLFGSPDCPDWDAARQHLTPHWEKP